MAKERGKQKTKKKSKRLKTEMKEKRAGERARKIEKNDFTINLFGHSEQTP